MAATTKITTLKLLIDKKSKRVVYAEAGKDFVDFLFGLMQVPLGTIMGSLLENYMPGSGSLGRINGSVINLSSSYLQPNVSKDVVLMPKLSSSSTIDSVPLLKNFVSKRKCESSYDQYGTYGSAKAAKVYPSSSKSGQGFVRGLMKYIVMDSLVVMPLSTFSVMSLLNQYRVKDFSSVEEKTVVINFDKGLRQTQSSLMYSSESPGTSRRNCDCESILLGFMREAISD